MNRNTAHRAAFLNLRTVTTVGLCSTTMALALVGLILYPRGTVFASQTRQLSFADRVNYQRAIEEVYWRHRLWPKENRDPKPSLTEAISPALLEEKVADYLRNSQALEDYWQRPITAEQLQAEMDRMAHHTQQRELFAALGNDPFAIAECLARPALASRLARSFYAYDQRFHSRLKARAEADLRNYPTFSSTKRVSGISREIEWAKSGDDNEGTDRSIETSVKVSSKEWAEKVKMLEAIVGDESGKFGSLQEDEWRYYAVTIIARAEDRVRLAIVEWRKTQFQSWKAKAETAVSSAVVASAGKFVLPAISEGVDGSIDEAWTPTGAAPTDRFNHTAVWTGTEMIVWGGSEGFNSVTNTGGRYNPATDSWTATNTTDAPIPRSSHVAFWTGSAMIVWGGTDSNFNDTSTGGQYDPVTDNWTATSTSNAPALVSWTAVWTGNEMIVWGQYFDEPSEQYLNAGGRYNPLSDSWVDISSIGAPAAQYGYRAVWTGNEMIVWGGGSDNELVNTGGRYNPVTDNWLATSTTNAPSGRVYFTTVWTGSEMIVWGGSGNGSSNTGAKYNPLSDSWTATSASNAPNRYRHTAVWTGSEMIVWGGEDTAFPSTGARYNPNTDSWVSTSITSAPTGRRSHTAVWTGSEVLIWGGFRQRTDFSSSATMSHTLGRYSPSPDTWIVASSTAPQGSHQRTVWTGSEMVVWGGRDAFDIDISFGGRYDAATDSWAGTTMTDAPGSRSNHTAIWTGSEMIVWGGYFRDGNLYGYRSGGRYSPLNDSWMPTAITNAPTERYDHTAIWTGSEMIVWGGYGGQNDQEFLLTGARYNPSTDNWTPTTTNDAPTERSGHTAVWTGNEMIVWGGSAEGPFLNDGGRYDVNTNSWMPIAVADAPTSGSTAVWTGNQMIVWGGNTNSGGRYDPVADSWVPLPTGNAPSVRSDHTAVWTGDEMIVWGGVFHDVNGDEYLNTGGRYNPHTDNWTATTTLGAPSARSGHVSVWTGNEMIVWGGYYHDGTGRYLNSGGRYFWQAAPTPTPEPTPETTPTPPPAPPTPTPSSILISGAIAYCTAPSPGPLPNVVLSLTGSASSSTLSDGSGNYAFLFSPAAGSYSVTPSKAALLPTSTGIDTMDAMAVQRHYLGVGLLTGCRLPAADVNRDTVINTNDVIAIQRFFIGRTFGIASVGEYQFIPASRTYSEVVSDQAAENYDALVLGDVASPFAEQ